MEPRIEHFIIRVNEVDNNRQLTIPALVCLLQEIAWNHANDLGVSIDQLLKENLTWVLVRMKIDLDGLPLHGDTLTIETWPSGIERLFVFRDFKLRIGNKIIGKVRSSWLVFNTKLRKWVRVPKFISEKVDSRISSPVRPRGSIEKLAEYQPERRFQVRLLETDLNGHANNISYFQWLVESLPQDYLETHRLSRLDIVFKAESILGDGIISRSGQRDKNQYLHQIVNQNDDELVRASTIWC